MTAPPPPRARHASVTAPAIAPDAARLAQVLARDPDADGRFWYGVRSTGVFCRPSCPSRRPRPSNVVLFASVDAARAAGFRACRRCRPEDDARQPAWLLPVCRALLQAERPPTLAALSRLAGVSPAHLQRTFLHHVGLSPHACAQALRGARMRAALAGGADVTTALHAAGFESASRFYAQHAALLGMPAARYRDGGRGERVRFALAVCSLGHLLVASSARGVCAIALGDDPDALLRELQDRFPHAELAGGDAAFERTVAQVVGLIERPRLGADLPLDIRGTAFQQRVWTALRAIPPGHTASYAEIAARIGAPAAVRAVAGACAANTLAVAVPCHRVVRTDGSLSGYRWGIDRKRTLLAREQAADVPSEAP